MASEQHSNDTRRSIDWTNVAARADGKRLFAQGSSGSTWILTPVINDHAGNEYLFKDCADEAIRWWKSVI